MDMRKIEEIHKRLDNLASGKIVKYDNAMNLATQYAWDYKNDVEYLLCLLRENTNEWARFVEEEARIHLDTIKQLQEKNKGLQMKIDAKIMLMEEGEKKLDEFRKLRMPGIHITEKELQSAKAKIPKYYSDL